MEAPTASVAGSRLSVVVHALNLVFLVLLAVAAGFGIRAVLLVQNIVPIHNLSDPETVFLTSLNLHSVIASCLTLFFAAFVAAQSARSTERSVFHSAAVSVALAVSMVTTINLIQQAYNVFYPTLSSFLSTPDAASALGSLKYFCLAAKTSLSFNNHAALCTTGRDLAWALSALSIGAFVLCLAVVVTWLTLRLKGLMAAHRSHEETHVVEMLFVATLAILALFGYLVFDGGHMKLSSHVLKAQGPHATFTTAQIEMRGTPTLLFYAMLANMSAVFAYLAASRELGYHLMLMAALFALLGGAPAFALLNMQWTLTEDRTSVVFCENDEASPTFECNDARAVLGGYGLLLSSLFLLFLFALFKALSHADDSHLYQFLSHEDAELVSPAVSSAAPSAAPKPHAAHRGVFGVTVFLWLAAVAQFLVQLIMVVEQDAINGGALAFAETLRASLFSTPLLPLSVVVMWASSANHFAGVVVSGGAFLAAALQHFFPALLFAHRALEPNSDPPNAVLFSGYCASELSPAYEMCQYVFIAGALSAVGLSVSLLFALFAVARAVHLATFETPPAVAGLSDYLGEPEAARRPTQGFALVTDQHRPTLLVTSGVCFCVVALVFAVGIASLTPFNHAVNATSSVAFDLVSLVAVLLVPAMLLAVSDHRHARIAQPLVAALCWATLLACAAELPLLGRLSTNSLTIGDQRCGEHSVYDQNGFVVGRASDENCGPASTSLVCVCIAATMLLIGGLVLGFKSCRRFARDAS